MRQINDAGLYLIKNFEGCRLTAYKAVSTETYYTIGWGHYGADVSKGMTITQAQADEMLKTDLEKYESYVNSTTYCPITNELNENQFSALVSFCYNCGAGSLKTLCRNRTAAQIAAAMPLYNKSGGNVLAGLVRRRAAEVELFNTPVKNITQEDDTMTGEAIYKALNDYLLTKQLPDWATDEFEEAKAAGITDGTAPMVLIPRYQAAIMALRAMKAAKK